MKKRILKVILLSLIFGIIITIITNFISNEDECGYVNHGFPFPTYMTRNPNYIEKPHTFPDLGCADINYSKRWLITWSNVLNLIIYFLILLPIIYITLYIISKKRKGVASSKNLK